MFEKTKNKIKKQAEEKEMSDQELVNLQRRKVEKRTSQCMQKITEILKEENCYIDVSVEISSRGTTPKIMILPSPMQVNQKNE